MHIRKAVDDLGRQLGLDGLELDANGLCTLNVGEGGSLFLERHGEALLVSLARRVAGHVPEALARGLALCHESAQPRHGLRVGLLRDNVLVACARLERHHLAAGHLAQTVPYLFETLDKTGA
ncbi:CesT family type III secretion system chaperone [Desulfocurvus vexinensis]|uniref:CesT family type III secretion system chaperone n=1 Tax=Desulfocurvus vexinensis TaxID=399548 RepID=UPI00048E0C9F|nr:CesT family type III secretion system chaperone [Desulfocurvus vexinensis]